MGDRSTVTTVTVDPRWRPRIRVRTKISIFKCLMPLPNAHIGVHGSLVHKVYLAAIVTARHSHVALFWAPIDFAMTTVTHIV